MSVVNNPAGRLHAILTTLDETVGGRTIGQAWSKALGVNEDDLPLLTSRIGEVFSLPQQIEDKLKWLDFYDDFLVSWRPKLAELFSNTTLSSQWTSVKGHLTSNVLSGVGACSKQLSRFAPEPTISDDDLTKLNQEIDELYQTVKDAEIDEKLENFILKHLEAIKDAIAEIQIKGASSIQKEMKAAVAEVAVDNDLRRKIESSEQGKDFWRFLERYLLLFAVITTPFQAMQLVNTVFPALNPPSAEAQPMNETETPQPPDTENSETPEPKSGDDIDTREI